MIVGPPVKWTIETMTEYSCRHQLHIIPIAKPINAHELCTWRCTICNSEFKKAFDYIRQEVEIRHRKLPICNGCKKKIKNPSHKANINIVKQQSIISSYLAGAVTFGQVKFSSKKKQKVFFRSNSLEVCQHIASLLETDAQPKPFGKKFSLYINNNELLSAFENYPKLFQLNKLHAHAWVRGYFDCGGYVDPTYIRGKWACLYGKTEIIEQIYEVFKSAKQGSTGRLRYHPKRHSNCTELIFHGLRGGFYDFLRWLYYSNSILPDAPIDFHIAECLVNKPIYKPETEKFKIIKEGAERASELQRAIKSLIIFKNGKRMSSSYEDVQKRKELRKKMKNIVSETAKKAGCCYTTAYLYACQISNALKDTSESAKDCTL
jgi:hypothetical protein